MTVAGGVVVALVASVLDAAGRPAASPGTRRARSSSAPWSLRRKTGRRRTPARPGAKLLGPDDRQLSSWRRGGRTSAPPGACSRRAGSELLQATGTLSATATARRREMLSKGARAKPRLRGRGTAVGGRGRRGDAALLRRLLLALLLGLVAAGTLGFVLSRTLTRSVGERRRPLGGWRRGSAACRSVRRRSRDRRHGHATAALDEALSTSEGRQREFLLSVSHEIRTPLTALRGYAEALAEGAIAARGRTGRPARRWWPRRRASTGSSRTCSLSPASRRTTSLEITDVDLADLVADLTSAWQATSDRAGVRLTTVPAIGPADVPADPMRLRQLLDGLVENAIRVAPDGGSVEVRVRRVGNDVVVEVEDAGPGLTPTTRRTPSSAARCARSTRPIGRSAPGWASPSPGGSPIAWTPS